jgi:lipopolysaccharide biosynthesis regulator YciM
MFQDAENYFRQATAIDPWNVRAQIALGKALCDQGRYEDGIAVYSSIRNAGSFELILRENLRLSLKLLAAKKAGI